MTTTQQEEYRRSLLPLGFLEHKKFTGPDLQIFSGAIKAYPVDASTDPSTQGLPLVQMRGSSTIFDLQQDCMLLSALKDMQNVQPGLTLWLNHSYNVPDDTYGTLYEVPRIDIQQQNIADLWLTANTVLRNPLAERTYQMIVQDKVRFGCSVGCEVVEWSFADESDEWNSPILIHHVNVLEWSVCGIPR